MKRKTNLYKQKYDKCLIITNGHTEAIYLETLINAYSGCIESKYNGAFVERYIYSDNGLIKENTKDKYVDICRKNASSLQLIEKQKNLITC